MNTTPKMRQLKISSLRDPRNVSYYPFIRLSGKYLLGFGFKIGDKVNLAIESDRIVITKIADTT